jgi:hypothetical protein
MKRTEQGRVTEEQLAELEEAAGRYSKPWTMGVGSYVMAALIRELRELRGDDKPPAADHVHQPDDHGHTWRFTIHSRTHLCGPGSSEEECVGGVDAD